MDWRVRWVWNLLRLGRPARRQAVHEEHLRRCRRVTKLLRFGVLRRRPPRARLVGILELEDHEARRVPVAFERLAGAAAGDLTPAVLIDGRGRELLVPVVTLAVVHIHFDDDVSRHKKAWLVQGAKSGNRSAA